MLKKLRSILKKIHFSVTMMSNNSEAWNTSSEALSIIQSLCSGANKISFYGYSQADSASAVCPVDNVFANVYCIKR